MAKRTASSDLNHDNWDRDEDPEEAGTFSKASEDDLKKRVIKVAKRRNPISSTQGEDSKPSAFGGFSGFGKMTNSVVTSSAGNVFGFLTNLTKKENPKINGASDDKTKQEKEPGDKKLDEYYAKLKGLNESVTEWIKKHVTENPLINLQPVFKDYDKYIAELDKIKVDANNTSSEASSSKIETFKFAPASTSSSTPPKLSFGATTTTSTIPSFTFGVPKSTAAATSALSFASTVTASSSSSGISFGDSPSSAPTSKPFTFGVPTSAPNGQFSFTSTVVKPADNKKEEPDEDEPPKVEFTPVVEKGNIYTIRCKVFVKKDDAFGDRGVGNLFLKPVPDSDKVQLIVRADTNLGNLICNFILSAGIPIKRMGKKDVMLVCLPTPDTKPPPVPILLRVKSPEDADCLFSTLQKHQK